MLADSMIEHINIEGNKTSDFNEWLQAMKMVAYLPDGTPSAFRRKLWLALSEQYLSMKNIDWERERVKYFCTTTQEDDENLGDQIIKDLHRTGTSLCSGPAGSVNQAKLKRILQGYARWNPEVGYCQGFNMLGALILQVMDMEEMESMKVMLFLIEGIFPSGYFNGSLNGLQVDMAVFRELMLVRLPKLAKHLQRLQGTPEERCCEPPLTNVFTIQWFITMFSTSLPLNSVLRIWDLVLIEGSGVLLRTALAIWSILEEKILCSRSADDFYCKMGKLSADMLNGSIINSNGLIEKIVEFGPIPQLERLRKKHLNNIKSWTSERNIKFPTLDEDDDSDDESEIQSSKTMAMRLVRRRSSRIAINRKTLAENRERIALDIPLLKKQYDRIREHQRQAHLILSAAVTRQSVSSSPATLTTNMLLDGRNANNVRRSGPSNRAIPPIRRSQYNCKTLTSSSKQSENNCFSISKKISPKLKKKLMYQKNEQLEEQIRTPLKSQSILNVEAKSLKRNDSSSFSDSDNNSSTSTSLCDDDDSDHTINFESSMELSPQHQNKNLNCPILKYDHLNIYNEKIINQTRGAGNDISIKESLNCDDSSQVAMDAKFIAFPSANISNIDIDKDINSFNNENATNIQVNNGSNSHAGIYAAFPNINKNFSDSTGSSLIALDQVCESNDLINLNSEEVNPQPTTNLEFSVNESGVINKYFERVNDIRPSTNINLDLLTFQNYENVPLHRSAAVIDKCNIIETTENVHKPNANMMSRPLSSENLSIVKELEKSGNQNCHSLINPRKSVKLSESSEQCQSELASRIIEENSRVLRRILNKDFTPDKNYSFNSVEVCNNNIDSSLDSLVENLEGKLLQPTHVNQIYKNEIFNFNIVQGHKNIKSENNHLVTLDTEKNISSDTNEDIIPQCTSIEKGIANFIDSSTFIEPKSFKSLTNEAFITQDFESDYMKNHDNSTISTENLSNRKNPYAVVIEDISPQTILKEDKITLPGYKKSSLLNSTTDEGETLSNIETGGTKSENTYYQEDIYNKYYNNLNVVENNSSDIGHNKISETCSTTCNKDRKVIPLCNHSNLECESNKPESHCEEQIDFQYLSKNCDKIEMNFSFDNHFKEKVSDKDLGLNEDILKSQIEYICDEVDNKKSYEKSDVKSHIDQLKHLSAASTHTEQYKNDMATPYIANYDLPEFLRVTTNKSCFDKDYIFGKDGTTDIYNIYEKFGTTPVTQLNQALDEQLNTTDITNQQTDRKITSKIDPTIINSQIDSKIATSDNMTNPLFNNQNINKYSEYSKDENINDRLISIKNTIKSIDSLCDDTIYNRFSRKEDDCQYDSLPLFSMKKELKHLKKYNFEEDNFTKGYTNLQNNITQNEIGREKPFKYFTSTDTSTSKIDLRHTVTSTLYARILAQGEEKKKSGDKHLCNNVSLKDTNSTHFNTLTTNSESAENWPIKIQSENENSKNDSKSCSNILL